MAHRPEPTRLNAALDLLTENGFDDLASAVEILVNEAMRIERQAFIGAAPYERSESRLGQANGFKSRSFKTRVGELSLEVPQVRGLEPGQEGFYPSALERGLRSERALTMAVAEMYINGVSTRKVTEVVEELCGFEITSTQVSRAAAKLDEELEAWRTRKLGEVPYMFLDARYEKVRVGPSVVDVALLVAVGVRKDGKRSILGVSVSLSEAEVHWRDFLASLQARGLHGLRCIVSDDHAGLKAARKARFASVPWQRCQCHLQQNAQAYVPRRSMRAIVAKDLRVVFNAPTRPEAERQLGLFIAKYTKTAPKLATWAEENIPEGLTVFDLPEGHQRRLRTTNPLERLNREIKRRTRVASLFPNDASLLRLASALLIEISEEWESGKTYLNLETT
jgi:transposase-like protein